MKINMTTANKLCCVGLAFFSCEAFSQVSSIKRGIFKPSEVSVELKPYPIALSNVPGLNSVGLGTELSSRGSVSTFVDAYVLDSNLPNGMIGATQKDDEPAIKGIRGYSADIGVRYNEAPEEAGSWYAGGKIGYSQAGGQWSYRDEKINHDIRCVTPGLEGGYRWIWDSNVLLRLGVGMDSNVTQKNSTSPVGEATAVTAEAENKVKDYASASVIPRADVGIGYAF